MKRFYLFVLLPFISLPVLAATKNKISMVTYFPVPYVAYSQVNTMDQMDIGLTSTCDMKLGCSDPSATLNATRVNLKGGKLNLDGGRGIKGYTLNLGNGSGEGKISFQNVRIQTGNMESVNAQDMKVSALELFGKTFPSCKEKDPSGQMQWASLKLKGADSKELYLACGGLGEAAEPDEDEEEVSCSDREYFRAHKAECCAKVDDPEASLGNDYCYLRKYTWVKRTRSLSGAQLGPLWRANNLGCLYPSEPIYPYNNGGSKCASSVKEGDECTRTSSDTFCYRGINGDEWWKAEGVSLVKLDPSNGGTEGPNAFCRCGGYPGMDLYQCGAHSYFCECRVSSWPVFSCEESFVKNGW